MAWVQPRHVPARQPAVRQLVRDDDVPRLAHGIAMRARRPRPSEKTALRLSPGPSPLGHLTWEPPPLEGRAPHARKEWLGPNRYMSPLGPRFIFEACGGNEMPGLAFGFARRTRRPRPYEKIGLRVVSRSSPQGHPSLHSPPPGGAGSARPQ
jgi:hypothetical protein